MDAGLIEVHCCQADVPGPGGIVAWVGAKGGVGWGGGNVVKSRGMWRLEIFFGFVNGSRRVAATGDENDPGKMHFGERLSIETF